MQRAGTEPEHAPGRERAWQGGWSTSLLDDSQEAKRMNELPRSDFKGE